MAKALVVLSGGQDSTTCLYWALQRFPEITAITFDYDQRHALEIEAATTIARMAGVPHEVIEVGAVLDGKSPLNNPAEDLETYENFASMDKVIGDRVELTFVPMRNALFLTLAANRASVGGFSHIVTGVCQQDNANYPDCRREFIESMETMINRTLGLDPSDAGYIMIDTPLMDMSKADSIRLAQTLPGCMDALAHSHTAYDGNYPPTGNDHASLLRAQGFYEAGVPDPLVVRAWREGLMELPGTTNYLGLEK